MKKYYLKIVFLIILFVLPISAKAECSYSQKVRLQKLAGSVNFSYRYTESQYQVTFQVVVSNLTSEIYMVDQSTGRYYYSDNKDFTINGYGDGKTIRYDFYAKDKDCSTTTIFSSYLTLPSYNPYYTSEICKGVEEFKFCQKWLKHSMSYREFYDEVMSYKNKTEEIPKVIKPKEEFKWDKVILFWSKYYIYILLTIIIGGTIILYRHDKKTDL